MIWQAPRVFPKLNPDELHVWKVVPSQMGDPSKFWFLLNAEEKDRANKFLVAAAKNSFVGARGVLRQLLGSYLNCDPGEIVFAKNPHGKLFLKHSALQFNLSHSHDLVLFTFALHSPIGVDVEFMRQDFEFLAIAQRFFAPKEVAALLALPKAKQRVAFFQTWARKEAFIKAIGKGVFYDLNKFTVTVSTATSGELQLTNDDAEYQNGWYLAALDPDENYAAAVAYHNVAAKILKFSLGVVA